MSETALLIFTLSKNEFVLANIDIIAIADSKELCACIVVYIPVCIVFRCIAVCVSWPDVHVVLYCWSQFFVACDPSAPRERLWQEEYSLHCEMVPSFIPQSLAQKVYSSIYSCILLLCVLLINWKINQFSVAKMS